MRYLILYYFFFIGQNVHSQINTELRLRDLLEKVEVIRDEYGVNHIYARNEHDLFLHRVIAQLRTGCFNSNFGEGKPPAHWPNG